MLGRKNYTKDEIDHAEASVAERVAAYTSLTGAIAGEVTGEKVFAALEDFEPLFFANMVLVLDRYFVHRIRAVTGKDGNPLNEVEIIADSLMNNDGILRGISVLKYVSDQSVLKLEIGDRIRVSADEFERLSAAFFAELRSRFLA
ncbi:hypothetical protein [Rhodococcus opacus]|uniref:hypothetical protein n=1 Tax=Rhodococcus opacus TaxID=37919 RepID=UPI0002DB5100|nr:hypothetical protein [Rhodococcus opacus]AHK29627.1 hypothetical protein Pd630_LPD02404 [Rhodococcus opacus PD630]UDG99378.1 hypothetical protein K2Z90_002299 [Rhodococcus opacus PD630]